MSQLYESAWERARRLKRRAFYESATQTIRSCPENYCLAIGGPGCWRPSVDAAIAHKAPQIVAQIALYARHSTSDALADAIGEVLGRPQP